MMGLPFSELEFQLMLLALDIALYHKVIERRLYCFASKGLILSSHLLFLYEYDF